MRAWDFGGLKNPMIHHTFYIVRAAGFHHKIKSAFPFSYVKITFSFVGVLDILLFIACLYIFD